MLRKFNIRFFHNVLGNGLLQAWHTVNFKIMQIAAPQLDGLLRMLREPTTSRSAPETTYKTPTPVKFPPKVTHVMRP